MGSYVNQDGAYYEGDRQAGGLEVPPRPSILHEWVGGVWQVSVAAANANLQAQIDQIERSTQENRGSREAWLFLLVERGAAQGMTPDQVYADNAFYRKLKDTDDAIRALREQMLP